jgi:D-beta-D-heptose 7-phosphate kinase/D-beta-D-heptose 1-phosphate adenosyltransferase
MNPPNFTVIGDVMLDKYVFGHVDRVSPESPVPVVCVDNVEYRLGGAANVAVNLRALGAEVKLLGVVGNDYEGKLVKSLLLEKGIKRGLVTVNNRPTTMKERIVAHAQHVVRVDVEVPKPIEYDILEQVLGYLPIRGPVIISDYNKGVVVPDIITMILERLINSGRMVILDPKLKDLMGRKGLYDGVKVIVPNHVEAGQAVNVTITDDESCERAILRLHEYTGAMSIVITRGAAGMSIYDGSQIIHIPSEAHEVYDVTGAGDTVVATMGYFLSIGYSLLDACKLANKAAGIVVGHQGVSTVTFEDLVWERDLK